MNGYTLGIMWNIGTLLKGTNRFCIQTSDESKLYYMNYIIKNVCPDREINERIRKLRGQYKKVYILNFTDKELATALRGLGYDDNNKSIPDEADDGFMCATFELISDKQTHGKSNDIWIRGNEYKCTGINHYINRKVGINKTIVNASTKNSKILRYTSTEYKDIIKKYSNISNRNISWWNDMNKWCNK